MVRCSSHALEFSLSNKVILQSKFNTTYSFYYHVTILVARVDFTSTKRLYYHVTVQLLTV